ncbi:hypothetical protein AVEN_256900-1 [Araneus ventricosus]|uniref:Uncharacterized protein n=1 Tax=Araneus ventricosus TaxID=182803 RepID=A0A4Y2CHJ0_ARAVE|nr:hypothetical protein AVEN_256900-1 [Araneus ventricosus]
MIADVTSRALHLGTGRLTGLTTYSTSTPDYGSKVTIRERSMNGMPVLSLGWRAFILLCLGYLLNERKPRIIGISMELHFATLLQLRDVAFGIITD